MNQNNKTVLIETIRSHYTEKKSTQLDQLKALDRKVKRPAEVFAYLFGSISAIITGSGMSLVMTDIGKTVGIPSPMLVGMALGTLGLALALFNYPIFKKILDTRRKKYAKQILSLSDELINEQ